MKLLFPPDCKNITKAYRSPLPIFKEHLTFTMSISGSASIYQMTVEKFSDVLLIISHAVNYHYKVAQL